VNVSFSRTLLHWEINYCLVLNCKHSTYSAKMIIKVQSTDMPHIPWKVENNSGTNLQLTTSRHKKEL
jgi:hypothetical protein